MTVISWILAALGLTIGFCIFWWAMIEAQEQASRENENRKNWKNK